MPIENPNEQGELEVKSRSKSQDLNVLQGGSYVLKDPIVGGHVHPINCRFTTVGDSK
jgi:hypothetical protein